jgi:hypothetical protein
MRKRNRSIKGVALTSKMSYRELIESGQKVRETDYVYSLLKEVDEPITSREISRLSEIERTSITRIFHDLIEDKLIKISKCDKCPITNRTVHFYTVRND